MGRVTAMQAFSQAFAASSVSLRIALKMPVHQPDIGTDSQLYYVEADDQYGDQRFRSRQR